MDPQGSYLKHKGVLGRKADDVRRPTGTASAESKQQKVRAWMGESKEKGLLRSVLPPPLLMTRRGEMNRLFLLLLDLTAGG